MWNPFDLCSFAAAETPADVKPPDNRCIPVRLLPHLFLGGINTIGDFQTLRELEITNILDVSDPFPGHLPRFPHDFKVTRITGGCRFLHNVANNFQFVEEVLQGIKTRGERILIFEFSPTSDRCALVEEKFPKENFRVNREMRDEILVYDPFVMKFWTKIASKCRENCAKI